MEHDQAKELLIVLKEIAEHLGAILDTLEGIEGSLDDANSIQRAVHAVHDLVE